MSLFSRAVQFFFENSSHTIMIFSYQILVIGLKTTHFQFASHSLSNWWSDLEKKRKRRGLETSQTEPKFEYWEISEKWVFKRLFFFSVLLIYHFVWFASRNLNGSCCFLLRQIELNSKDTVAIFLLLNNKLSTCCCVQIHQTVYNNREKIVVLKATVLRKGPRLIAHKNTVKMTCIAITLKFIYHKCDCGIN